MSYLTSTAKAQLAKTIRSLRDRLLNDLHNAVESTYLMGVKLERVKLDEERHRKRQRLEDWLAMQVKGELAIKKGKVSEKLKQEMQERHRRDLEKLAAATWLNRLVAIKHLEAMDLIKPKVLTGGWQSQAYKEFREFAPELLQDEMEGFGVLLRLVFDELAIDLPGLFGRGGAIALIPMPATTLRHLVEELEKLDPDVWRDDTTLGWIYQYWNDPEREGLDAKLNRKEKIEPHEIASKTQMFTERYMVEWLLQNSLNNQWLDICAANGWTAEAVADGTLTNLETRRQVWRQRREAGSVALDALMPIETEQEQRWKYWVKPPSSPQPPSPTSGKGGEDLSASTPAPLALNGRGAGGEGLSLRNLKLIDPACGSGHFLVIACDLLFAFYQEEARHRGEVWTDAEIVNSILENNLHGIDIDPRAVQIAAAALWLKAKGLCKDAAPKQINLVAANLNLANLPQDDEALLEFYEQVRVDTGIPKDLTRQIVESLKGADAWGSLLRVDEAVRKAISQYEWQAVTALEPQQGDIFGGYRPAQVRLDFDAKQAKSNVLAALEEFLQKKSRGDDLGVRLLGEQLAAGVRFVRLVREGQYDLVVGNPPYQGTSKMADAGYLSKHYPRGKADLYAAFLQRGLELAKDGGFSALLTMRNWMFIKDYSRLREFLIENYDLRLLGDIDRGGFEAIVDEVVSTVMSIFVKKNPSESFSIAIQPTPLDDNSRDGQRTNRKRAAILAHVGRYEFKTQNFNVIKEKPLIYWWDDAFLKLYAETPKLGDETDVCKGIDTGINSRFLREPWEIDKTKILLAIGKNDLPIDKHIYKWVPYIKGAEGKAWYEPLSSLVCWKNLGLEIQVRATFSSGTTIRNSQYFFQIGAAFSTIGAEFNARSHRFRSVIDAGGSSVFPNNLRGTTCLLNSQIIKDIASALNPTVNFKNGDIKRLPLFPIESANEIFAELEKAFSEHEAGRETSVEFISPRPSAWRKAQEWAQAAVDRPAGSPLPPYIPTYDPPSPTDFVSYAVGLALGRFENPFPVFPNNILYLSTYSHDLPDIGDSLTHPAAVPIHEAWAAHGSKISKTKNLRDWLRQDFFKDDHVKRYDQRPIYFPISSTKKNFVAYISIHGWTDNTLKTLLADYLLPDRTHLEGELSDLQQSRNQGDSKTRTSAEKRYTELTNLLSELQTFIKNIQDIAERGAPPAKPSDPPRQVEATFRMDLDDGVMVNSAALWTLLEPQWNKPKGWWSELCTAQGKKDYDWSHLAARYFPDRIDTKCQADPSLAVAHGVFWKYHPAKAFEWELRLQDEIAPDFHIQEPDSQSLRDDFIRTHPDLVLELRQKEIKRRERKRNKQEQEEEQIAIDMDEDYSEE